MPLHPCFAGLNYLADIGRLLACGAMVLALAARPEARAAEPPTVNVILWFDTEDYLSPADDDATKRLAEMLTERGIRATFKLVGEKARVLERRGRGDVIAALRRHAIGYHTDFHSVHPTPSEYLAESGFLDGVADFVRRESRGAADVRRIFDVPTLACYGQPGSSWASQALAALPQIGVAPEGVPCYVDDGSHVGLGGRPFWYENAIVVYDMQSNVTRMDLHDPAALVPAKEKVTAIVRRLAQSGSGGLVSIYYHPCEWIHQQFWDGVNFQRGANPPREQWRPPPQRTPDQTEAAFQRFGAYIDHIRSLPGVRFVTASDLPRLYPDPVRHQGASAEDLAQLAQAVIRGGAAGVDFLAQEGRSYSLADQFELLTVAVNQMLTAGGPGFPIVAKGLLGPDGPPPLSPHADSIPWPAFQQTARDTLDFITRNGRVPARVFVGPDPVPPADFLMALARVFDSWRTQGRPPTAADIPLGSRIQVLPAGRVAADTPGLFGGWVIHKEGFRAPKILEVAKWQTWTLKPVCYREP